jgi:hypothetical protein
MVTAGAPERGHNRWCSLPVATSPPLGASGATGTLRRRSTRAMSTNAAPPAAAAAATTIDVDPLSAALFPEEAANRIGREAGGCGGARRATRVCSSEYSRHSTSGCHPVG